MGPPVAGMTTPAWLPAQQGRESEMTQCNRTRLKTEALKWHWSLLSDEHAQSLLCVRRDTARVTPAARRCALGEGLPGSLGNQSVCAQGGLWRWFGGNRDRK